MAQETLFKRISDKAPGQVGDVLDVIGTVVDVFRRNPNVRAWAKAKRQEKRRLKGLGLDKAVQKQRLRAWISANPKPRGSEPYNPMKLGVSNQMNANAQALGGGGNMAFGLGNGMNQPTKSGFNFMNPFVLLLGVPILLSFVFPKQFKRLRKSIKI
jgi:hypothetical protein